METNLLLWHMFATKCILIIWSHLLYIRVYIDCGEVVASENWVVRELDL